MRFSFEGIKAPFKAVAAFLRQRRRRKDFFHDWFAWHPVYVGESEWAWLETVERRRRNVFNDDKSGSVWLCRVRS